MQAPSTQTRSLPTRAEFLAQHLTPLTVAEIETLNADTTREPECCMLCLYRDLSTRTSPDHELPHTEKAVRLPCKHVFGENCIVRYFSTTVSGGFYNHLCPCCRQGLYSQERESHWYNRLLSLRYRGGPYLLIPLRIIGMFLSFLLMAMSVLTCLLASTFSGKLILHALFGEPVGAYGGVLSLLIGVPVGVFIVPGETKAPTWREYTYYLYMLTGVLYSMFFAVSTPPMPVLIVQLAFLIALGWLNLVAVDEDVDLI
jgi:hypothetical protein